MKTFLQFISENNTDLNMDYISSILNVKSINIPPNDFTSVKYKKEIQFLFKDLYFPNSDKPTLDTSKIDEDKLREYIDYLRGISKKGYLDLFNSTVMRTYGPGEKLLYYIYDKCRLGGASSAGADIIFPEVSYEIKGARLSVNGFYVGFMLGQTFSTKSIINKIYELATKDGYTKSEVPISKMRELKEKFPKEFNELESEYASLTYDNYFSKHQILFFNSADTSARGSLLGIESVKKEDIFIGELTSGVIKPRVKKSK